MYCHHHGAQSYLTLCAPMDCGPPGSSVHGIFQARILEWVAFPTPGDLPDPGVEPASCIAGGPFTTVPSRSPKRLHSLLDTNLKEEHATYYINSIKEQAHHYLKFRNNKTQQFLVKKVHTLGI